MNHAPENFVIGLTGSLGSGCSTVSRILEDNGFTQGSDSTLVSERAKKRGIRQLGSLGSGNHFIEIQRVAEIFDEEIAKTMGLEQDKDN